MTDENMTGTDAEGVDWGDMAASPEYAAVAAANAPVATYPEYNDNPHNHRFTISLAPDKPPFIVVRGNTATEITAAFNELEVAGVYANLAAAWASLKVQGTLGAGLGPVSPVGPSQAAPAASAPPRAQYAPPPQQSPGAPPFGPNVSAPQAPGYQGPPQQQGWGGQQAAPQGGGWGGGRSSGPQEKPRPEGWAMVDVPFNDKDRFKALRVKGTESEVYLRGKVQWGGKGVYWLDPSVAGWIAQQGFPVMQ